MRKKICVALLIVSVIVLLPISPYGNKGYYNGLTNTLYCNDPYSCRHEIGHRMDAETEHPSRSAEFAHAIQLYLYVELHKKEVSDFPMMILVYPPMMSHQTPRFPIMTSGQEELYADMYGWVDGEVENLPKIFRQFYSRDEKYKKLYSCLISAEVKICNKSLYIEKRQDE